MLSLSFSPQTELNEICYTLSPDSWLNPHKSVLGLGNYDINVITAALNTRQMGLVWFDKRKDPRTIKERCREALRASLDLLNLFRTFF